MGDHITKTSSASFHHMYNIRRITKNVQKHWYMRLFLGPIHTHPFSFENATVSLRIRPPSTCIRWKQSMQTDPFSNIALQSGTFWKRCFRAYVWTDESGTFRKRWGHTISSNPLRAILETYSRWRTSASLSCLLYLLVSNLIAYLILEAVYSRRR